MSQERTELIRRQVLKILNDCGPYLVPQDTLYQHALLLIPGLLRSEFLESVAFLETQGFCVGVRSTLGNLPKWRITESGKAVLCE